MSDGRGPITKPLYAGNELHPFKDLLSGTWLGRPLHPMLTELPIGFWTSAWVLDIIGPRRYRDAARVLARRRGRNTQGIVLGMAGAAAATVGGYLGGHLVQGRGVGVDANRDDVGPENWTRVLDADELTDEPVRVDAAGVAVSVVRRTRERRRDRSVAREC